jgi:hypothetical protein
VSSEPDWDLDLEGCSNNEKSNLGVLDAQFERRMVDTIDLQDESSFSIVTCLPSLLSLLKYRGGFVKEAVVAVNNNIVQTRDQKRGVNQASFCERNEIFIH